MKLNPVFISPDGGRLKPFCNVCGVYMQLFKLRYRCPMCGANADDASMVNSDRKILVAKDSGEAMVGNKKKAKKQIDADYPQGATIIREETYSSV